MPVNRREIFLAVIFSSVCLSLHPPRWWKWGNNGLLYFHHRFQTGWKKNLVLVSFERYLKIEDGTRKCSGQGPVKGPSGAPQGLKIAQIAIYDHGSKL